MKLSMGKKTWIGAAVAVTFFATTAFSGIAAAPGQPGSADDPIVTKSYVDQVKEEMKAEILEQVLEEASASKPGAGIALVVEALEPGESIIGFSGTEFIVRTGEVVAIEGANGDGITDITEGTNIDGGQVVEHDHLLLLPRDDGRGLKVQGTQTAYIMVRGEYTIPGREMK